MKLINIMCLSILLATPALAEDKAVATVKTTCGKTVEDCQKVIDSQTTQVKQLTTAYQTVREQRNQSEINLLDAQLNSYLISQNKETK